MNQPSPAPWSIGSEYDNSRDEIEDAEGRTIATVWTRRACSGAYARPQFKDCTIGKANARLIAASPVMKDSLKRLADASAAVGNMSHAGIPIPDEAWAALYAANNEARGILSGI